MALRATALPPAQPKPRVVGRPSREEAAPGRPSVPKPTVPKPTVPRPTAPKRALAPAIGQRVARPAPEPMGQPPAKKPRQPGILVTREQSDNESEGLEILLGRYECRDGRDNHGQLVYEKVESQIEDFEDDLPVFLYFWENEEGDERGWWLGHEVGGAEAYAFAPGTSFPPPVTGWRIPTEDMPFVEDLRVKYPAPSINIDATVAAASASTAPSAYGSSTWVAKRPRSSALDYTADDSPREDFSHLAGIRMEGKIRNWKYDWGFITSPDNFEGDLFVHKNQLRFAVPHAGKKVSFEIDVDDKGRGEAMEVIEVEPVAAAVASLAPVGRRPVVGAAGGLPARRAAELAMGLPAEEAVWLELFLKAMQREKLNQNAPAPKKKFFFWGILNATKNNSDDPALSEAAENVMASWKEAKDRLA